MLSRQFLQVCANCARQARVKVPKSRAFITGARPQTQHTPLRLRIPSNDINVRTYVTQSAADVKIEELQELYGSILLC